MTVQQIGFIVGGLLFPVLIVLVYALFKLSAWWSRKAEERFVADIRRRHKANR